MGMVEGFPIVPNHNKEGHIHDTTGGRRVPDEVFRSRILSAHASSQPDAIDQAPSWIVRLGHTVRRRLSSIHIPHRQPRVEEEQIPQSYGLRKEWRNGRTIGRNSA